MINAWLYVHVINFRIIIIIINIMTLEHFICFTYLLTHMLQVGHKCCILTFAKLEAEIQTKMGKKAQKIEQIMKAKNQNQTNNRIMSKKFKHNSPWRGFPLHWQVVGRKRLVRCRWNIPIVWRQKNNAYVSVTFQHMSSIVKKYEN